jgi:hypothetical protein
VDYGPGVSSQVQFVNVQQLLLNPDANHSYVQTLALDVLGQPASPGEVQQLVAQLTTAGRGAVVRSLELSAAGRQQTVQSWFIQYAGRTALFSELLRWSAQLRKQTEEVVLSKVLFSIFRGPAGGSFAALLNLAGQAVLGRSLTPAEVATFRRRGGSAGRQGALLALLKSRTYRLHLVEGYVRRLFQVPANQPLSPADVALVMQLAFSKLDQRNIRIALETNDQFFING